MGARGDVLMLCGASAILRAEKLQRYCKSVFWAIAPCVGLFVGIACFAGPLSAQVKWEMVEGGANDIALAGDGTVWVIGTAKAPGGFGIYQSSPTTVKWDKIPGAALRIAVEGQSAWVVNDSGAIFRLNGAQWQNVGGPKAIDIGANAKGVWIVAEPKTGNDYSVYKWTGTNWSKITGAAVRIDVDASGNAWAVDSAGALYAFVANQWQFFAVPEAAADLSVDVFGEPWIVTKGGALRHFSNASKQWGQAGSAVAGVALRGRQLWQLGAKQEIQRQAVAQNIPVTIAPLSLSSGPPTTLSLSNPTSLTVTMTGPDGKPLTADQLKPNTNQSNLNSTSVNPFDAKLTTGSSLQPNGLPTGGLEVGGCFTNPKLPDCASQPLITTAAASGKEIFPEPGLGGFLVSGALPLFEQVLQNPGLIMATLERDDRITTLKGRQDEFGKVCVNPTENSTLKGLMFLELVNAIKTAPSQRTAAQQAFVDAFGNYMYYRRLFIAERAQYLYEQWKLKEMLKLKSSLQQTFVLPQVPPDVFEQARAAAAGTAATAAIVGSIAVAGGAVAAFGVAQAAAVGYVISGSIYGLMTGGLAATTISAAGLAALAAGPAAIVLAGGVVIAVVVDQAIKADAYEKKLASSLATARIRPNLENLVETTNGVRELTKSGVGELVFYWSNAVSVPGPVTFATSGNPTTACNQGFPRLQNVPPEVKDGRFNLAPSITVTNAKTKKSQTFGGPEALAASGLSWGASHLNNLTLGESAWISRSTAMLGCMASGSIKAFQASGRSDCASQINARLQNRYIKWIYQPGYNPNPGKPFDLNKGNGGALPPDSVVAGATSGIKLQVCRADMGDGWHPGKVWGDACHVAWGTGAKRNLEFDVLTASFDAIEWLPMTKGQATPANAVEADTHKDGTRLYVCRADMGNGIHPGKIWGGRCHVAFGKGAIAKDKYDVLVHLVPWGGTGGPRASYPARN